MTKQGGLDKFSQVMGAPFAGLQNTSARLLLCKQRVPVPSLPRRAVETPQEARRTVAVLLVHHAGVNGRQRGTSRREDALDTVIALRRPADYSPEQGARFEVHIEKARTFAGEGALPFEAAVEPFVTDAGLPGIRWVAVPVSQTLRHGTWDGGATAQ